VGSNNDAPVELARMYMLDASAVGIANPLSNMA